MNRIRNLTRILQPADLFSPLVLIGVTVEFGVLLLASPYNSNVHVFLNMISFVATVIVSFTIQVFIYAILHKHLNEAKLRKALLITVPISSVIGGVFLGWIRYTAGWDDSSLIGMRTLTALLNITPTTILLWLANSGVRQHYKRLDALVVEQERLDLVRIEVQNDLEILNESRSEAVRNRILKDLERLSALDARGALSALIATIENTVRPLSRQIESETPDWVLPHPITRERQRINWWAVMVDATLVKFFNPVGVLTIISLIALNMNVVRVGLDFALQFLVLTILIVWPMFLLIKKLFLQFAKSAKGFTNVIIFIVMCVSCGFVWAGLTLPLTLKTPNPFRGFTLLPIFTFAIAYFWGLANAAISRANTTEMSYRNTTYELLWRITRKRELYRQQCRALAHALHGQVQATLAAGILELERELKLGDVSHEKLEAVRSRITECVSELNLRELAPIGVEQIIQKVSATWAGVARAAISIDPKLEVALGKDPQLLVTLNDVIPELVFNSVKHGKASQIDFVIEQVSSHIVSLVVEDNGHSLDSSIKEGLGSELLNTCAISWNRERVDGRTVTTLLLPFAGTSSPINEGFPSNLKYLENITL